MKSSTGVSMWFARFGLVTLCLLSGAVACAPQGPTEARAPAEARGALSTHRQFFLGGSGSALTLSPAAPSVATATYTDSDVVRFAGDNPWRPVGTWSASPPMSSGGLVALTDALLWLGLKNSDGIGTHFDVRAEVYKNLTLVAAGETLCVEDLARDPALATPVIISFGPPASDAFDGVTDVLSLRISTRLGTVAGGALCGRPQGAPGLRTYFNAFTRSASFGARFCTPESCSEQGLECGAAPDRCGATLDCGTCAPGQRCGAVTPNQCCTPRTCAALGAGCGTLPDGCGATLDCGTCASGQRCGAVVANQCCAPTTCAAQGKNCGTIPDGCGATLDCGACAGTCSNGVCGSSCGPTTCPTGCCSGDICVPHWDQAPIRCGSGGAACEVCSGGFQGMCAMAPGLNGGTCGPGVSCGPSTCPSGCCRGPNCLPTSVQLTWTSRGARMTCGSGGAFCDDCPFGLSCQPVPNGGVCALPPDAGTGCNAMNCQNGCCLGSTCVAPLIQTWQTCGGGGAACAQCGLGSSCQPAVSGNACVAPCGPANCPLGCCSGSTCVSYAAQNQLSCGIGGNLCQTCPPMMSCQLAPNGGLCAGGGVPDAGSACGPTTCPFGCCQNGVCLAAAQEGDFSCGSGGGICVSCPMGTTCQKGGAQFGQCTPVVDAGAPAASCGPANCPFGCCSGATCVQPSQQSQQNCGSGGSACLWCLPFIPICQQTPSGGSCVAAPSTGACTAASCPLGCCSGDICLGQYQQMESTCGEGGAACQVCAAGQMCQLTNLGRACSTPVPPAPDAGSCSAANCPLGCCSGATCVFQYQQSTMACGEKGAACQLCAPGVACVNTNYGRTCLAGPDGGP